MAVPATQTGVQILERTQDWFKAIAVKKDLPVEAPGAGFVTVRIKARPINPADVFCAMGLYPAFQPSSYPAYPGMEGTGEIVAVGPGVSAWSVGQRVLPLLWPSLADGNGLYREYVNLEADYLVSVPDDITDEQAGCAVVNPATAIGLLAAIGDVPQGQYITITAAGSAVGKMLLGICKKRGVQTIAVVRRRETFEELKALGATECVSLDEDVAARILEITGGKGHWGALDCIFGDVVSKLAQATRFFGKVVVYGALTSASTTVTVAETLFRSVSVSGYWIQLEIKHMSPAERKQRMDEVFALFREGTISSGVALRLPLESALEAFKAHAEGKGKVLLTSP